MINELKTVFFTNDRLDRNTDLEIYRYGIYGKNFIKTCNCSPDAYMQMVLQLTYYK